MLTFKDWSVDLVSGLLGKCVRCLYPRHNYHGLPQKLEPRVFLVKEVRDMRERPVEPAILLANPLLRRGRWLLTVDDCDKHEERSVYLESMQQIEVVDLLPETEEFYRVVMIDPRGRERVPAPCLRQIEAEAFIDSCNERTIKHGLRAEGREIRLPRLTCNLQGQVQ